MTGTGAPSGPGAVTVLAYGRPVSSRTGSASSSVRSSTTGPGPLRSTPTTPWPPTPAGDRVAVGGQPAGEPGGGAVLGAGQLGVAVHVEVELGDGRQYGGGHRAGRVAVRRSVGCGVRGVVSEALRPGGVGDGRGRGPGARAG